MNDLYGLHSLVRSLHSSLGSRWTNISLVAHRLRLHYVETSTRANYFFVLRCSARRKGTKMRRISSVLLAEHVQLPCFRLLGCLLFGRDEFLLSLLFSIYNEHLNWQIKSVGRALFHLFFRRAALASSPTVDGRFNGFVLRWKRRSAAIPPSGSSE